VTNYPGYYWEILVKYKDERERKHPWVMLSKRQAEIVAEGIMKKDEAVKSCNVRKKWMKR